MKAIRSFDWYRSASVVLILMLGCSRGRPPVDVAKAPHPFGTAADQPTKGSDSSLCHRPPPGARARRPPMRQKLDVLTRFDENRSGRLEFTEREAARSYLADERRRMPSFPVPPQLSKSTESGGPGGPGGPFARLPPAVPGPRIKPSDVPSVDTSVALYEPATLRTMWLTFDRDDWERELAEFYDTDVQLPARLSTGGIELNDVGVQFRGMSSYMMVPSGFKRSLNLSIDPIHHGQKLLGYRNLNWLNGAHDPTFLRTILAATIMQDYVPAPSANHVRVVINGESWGLYVNVQPFDNNFVAERFGESSGRRWKVPGSPDGHGNLMYLGDDPKAYQDIYDLKSKADEGAYRDLIHLCKTLTQSSGAQLERDLSAVLDVDEAIRYLALDNLLVNSDSYLARSSDYGLYQAKDGKFRLIPHDIDETFNAFEAGPGGSHVGIELDPLAGADNPERPLIAKILSVPTWRSKYLATLHAMAEKWLNWERLSPIIAAYEPTIREELQRDTRKLSTLDEFSAGLDTGFVREGPCGKERVFGLKAFVDQRRAYLLKHKAFSELPRATR